MPQRWGTLKTCKDMHRHGNTQFGRFLKKIVLFRPFRLACLLYARMLHKHGWHACSRCFFCRQVLVFVVPSTQVNAIHTLTHQHGSGTLPLTLTTFRSVFPTSPTSMRCLRWSEFRHVAAAVQRLCCSLPSDRLLACGCTEGPREPLRSGCLGHATGSGQASQ